MAKLEIKKLSFSYKNGFKIFDDINLDFQFGKCYSLMGDSGSGKTTFLKIISGLIPDITEGELSGNIISESSKKLKPAVVLDDIEAQLLYEEISSELDFFIENSESFNFKDRDDFFSNFRLNDLKGKNTFNMSSGEKQKYLLSMAMAFSKDKILLLDEPFNHLDEKNASDLINILTERKKNNFLILITGNFLNCPKELIDFYYKIENKKIVESVKPIFDMPFIEAKAHDEIILETENLGYSANNLRIIDKVNISFQKGGIYGICGRNGCGKTTLAKVLCGYLKDYTGSIKANIKEEDIFYISPKPINQLYYPKVIENLHGYLDMEDMESALKKANLEEKKNFYVSMLSRTEKEKLLIYAALYKKPKLLIIDEPLLGLNFYNERDILYELKKYVEEGGILILISHNLDFLKSFNCRIYSLDRDLK